MAYFAQRRSMVSIATTLPHSTEVRAVKRSRRQDMRSLKKHHRHSRPRDAVRQKYRAYFSRLVDTNVELCVARWDRSAFVADDYFVRAHMRKR